VRNVIEQSKLPNPARIADRRNKIYSTQGEDMNRGVKKLLMGFYNGWDGVMNLKYNPIRFMGSMAWQMYSMTLLSIIWSCTFCALFAGWQGIIPLLYGHVALVAVIFFTYATFKEGNERNEGWFKSWQEEINKKEYFTDTTKNTCKWDLEKEA